MKPTTNSKMFSKKKLQPIMDGISPILNSLPEGMTVITENFYPRDVWKSTSSHQRRVIGMQIAYLVNQQSINLQRPDENDEATQRYIVT